MSELLGVMSRGRLSKGRWSFLGARKAPMWVCDCQFLPFLWPLSWHSPPAAAGAPCASIDQPPPQPPAYEENGRQQRAVEYKSFGYENTHASSSLRSASLSSGLVVLKIAPASIIPCHPDQLQAFATTLSQNGDTFARLISTASDTPGSLRTFSHT
jgi:hypothetical protein